MRLLVLSPFLPVAPARHGSAVYLHALLAALAELAEVRLLSFATPAEEAALPEGTLPRGCSVLRVPRRTLTDLGLLGRCGAKLRSGWFLGPGGLPIAVSKLRSTAMRRALRRLLVDDPPDAILIEMTLMGQYLRDCGGIPTILTDHEAATAVPAGVIGGRFGAARERRNWDRYFSTMLAQPTALQALNHDDAETLARRSGRKVGVRPLCVPIPTARIAAEDAAEVLLFMGDYSHQPNREAAVHLACEILPRVRARRPEAELILAGGNPTPAIRELATRPGVRVPGLVADLETLLRSGRMLVAPLFSGSGTRIKVLTALAHGVPVVANALAARGIDAPATALARAETAADISALCVALLDDPSLARRASLDARAWAEVNLSPRHAAEVQLASARELLAARANPS